MVLVLGLLSGLEFSRNKVCREVWRYFLGVLEQWIPCSTSHGPACYRSETRPPPEQGQTEFVGEETQRAGTHRVSSLACGVVSQMCTS